MEQAELNQYKEFIKDMTPIQLSTLKLLIIAKQMSTPQKSIHKKVIRRINPVKV